MLHSCCSHEKNDLWSEVFKSLTVSRTSLPSQNTVTHSSDRVLGTVDVLQRVRCFTACRRSALGGTRENATFKNGRIWSFRTIFRIFRRVFAQKHPPPPCGPRARNARNVPAPRQSVFAHRSRRRVPCRRRRLVRFRRVECFAHTSFAGRFDNVRVRRIVGFFFSSIDKPF